MYSLSCKENYLDAFLRKRLLKLLVPAYGVFAQKQSVLPYHGLSNCSQKAAAVKSTDSEIFLFHPLFISFFRDWIANDVIYCLAVMGASVLASVLYQICAGLNHNQSTDCAFQKRPPAHKNLLKPVFFYVIYNAKPKAERTSIPWRMRSCESAC